jgi:predicted nucleic acid-binding protein
MVIATFCIDHDHTLLHNDRDFAIMETYLGLKVL